MRSFLLRRLLQAAATVLLVATITFVLAHLAPGDPFTSESRSGITEALRAERRAHYGLDRPLPEQYARWLWNLARGDLGHSLSLNVPVRDALAAALPNTLLLLGVSLAGMFALGILLGAVQAARRGTWWDRGTSAVSLFFYSVPDFWLALMAMLLFAQWMRVLPVGGIVSADVYPYLESPWARAADRLAHLVLPVGTLVLLNAGGIARFQRAALLDVAGEDWLRTARAKGLGERAVLLRHALRNALLPVITLMGISLPALVGGAIYVEYVFAWPGMGRLAVDAVGRRDYELVMACAVLGAVLVAAGSLLADLLHALADPRLREESA